MKTKVIHISILVIMALFIIGIFYILISNIYDEAPIRTKTSNIIINNDGTIDVIDNILIDISQSRKQ